jgi:signal transduction histidine kinase
MRVADFIVHDMEAILVKWEEFAATLLPAAANMDSLALRDHARQILEAVAKDMATSQTREAQLTKSLGQAPRIMPALETAAQTHAMLRAQSGFDINQLVAEYRALRASVLRLWGDAHLTADSSLDEVCRFNEAIDQAIAESVGSFSAQQERVRDLFLGVIGHDLRTPLQTIHMTAAYLGALDAGEKISESAARLIKSGGRMQALLDDLLDFNRTKLGLGINIAPTDVDVRNLFADELAQLRIAHPGHRIELEVTGDTRGVWDGPRLQQLLGNLVVNAIKYGLPDAPVQVAVTGDERELRVEVRNSGPAIDPKTMAHLFEPLKRGAQDHARPYGDAGLGLGLYIAREITKSHGGSIETRSAEEQTVFAIQLPRRIEHPSSAYAK